MYLTSPSSKLHRKRSRSSISPRVTKLVQLYVLSAAYMCEYLNVEYYRSSCVLMKRNYFFFLSPVRSLITQSSSTLSTEYASISLLLLLLLLLGLLEARCYVLFACTFLFLCGLVLASFLSSRPPPSSSVVFLLLTLSLSSQYLSVRAFSVKEERSSALAPRAA